MATPPTNPKTLPDTPSQQTAENFENLGRIISRHLDFATDDTPPKNNISPAVQRKPHPLLRILKPVPWLLAVVFVVSFVWDFNGVEKEIFGINFAFQGILKIVSVSGLIGFLTNWVAITMLFRPLKKRPLLGQGLIPAHKKRIAYRLARAVSEDLINPDIIKQKIRESSAISRYRGQALTHLKSVLEQPAFRSDLKAWILSYINSLVNDPDFRQSVARHAADEIEQSLEDRLLEKAALKTYSLLKGQSLNALIEDALTKMPHSVERNIGFVEELMDQIPAQFENNADKLDDMITTVLYRLINQLDVQTLVEENLEQYDELKLESMIRNATNEQLKTIQYLGAILGTIGGFVIWHPVLSLSVLTTVFGSVYLADRMLYR